MSRPTRSITTKLQRSYRQVCQPVVWQHKQRELCHLSEACLLAALWKSCNTYMLLPDDMLLALQALLSLCRSTIAVFPVKDPFLPIQTILLLQEHTAKEMEGSHGPDHTSASEPQPGKRGKAKRAD